MKYLLILATLFLMGCSHKSDFYWNYFYKCDAMNGNYWWDDIKKEANCYSPSDSKLIFNEKYIGDPTHG